MSVYDTKTVDPSVKPSDIDSIYDASDRGTKDSVANIDRILIQMNADHPGDIIADILHWCDRYGEDWDNLVYIGTQYYLEENNG